MDWISVFLLIFSLTALIVAIANVIYFWRAYSLPVIGVSTGTSITLLIVNVIVAVMALAGLIWALYILFTSRSTTEVSEETVITNPNTGTTTVIPKTCVPAQPAGIRYVPVSTSVNGVPSATAIISRA
ncbi:putative transmembrane protein [Cedratvirus kamchatka]|uniref:Transmembrane protein n=1 Tax=Cedratvirus kamchatka TaxID=2716914 RepID=A0A6G8MYE8_9VIRU|nr:putative transmembrane protein [Cedratvirus kamchatka]WIL04453.1 putative membrane protein [Cedratvirus lena]WIL04486.1 putative membrane protein [Cedratvirus duvanny]